MRQILALVLTCLIGLSATHGHPTARNNDAGARSSAQQILVMLRQPPAHYRGGTGYQGGYVDARRTTAREQTGRRLAKLHGLRFVGFYPMAAIGLDCVILEADRGAIPGLATLIAAIERDADVEWAEPVQPYEFLGATGYNDPLFAATPAATQWHLAELHLAATGKGVTIAVVDSGVDSTHPDLKGQIRLNRNFVDGHGLNAEAHGTGVAGIIVAKANNQQGMVGIAPDARLFGLRACWQQGRGEACDSLSLAKALDFAIEKQVDILNLSLTGPSSRLLTRLIDKAIASDIIVVAAVDSAQAGGGFPASSLGVIAVTDDRMTIAAGHMYRAPGQDIPTTQPRGKWYVVHGSSFAAAHVSGLFALMIERRGGSRLRPALVKVNDGSQAVDARASVRMAASR